jgi:hypothetical protein
MAKSQILTGARAKVQIVKNGKAVTVGLFANCSWSVNQEKVPAYILGRYSPAEITPTSQEPVRMSLTGYRVVDKGPYDIGVATKLIDLLQEEDFGVQVIDRQTGKQIFKAEGCRVTGWSSGVASRGVSDLRIDVIGMIGFDEFSEKTGDNESATAAKLDDA